ncbi:polyketide synthase dehydratase domain-containing protein, partial [Burkholderia pseudomallei]
AAPAAARVDVAALLARCTREIGAQRFYTFLDSGGGHYGPTFRSVAALHQGEREVLARLALPESVAHADAFVLHPSMMDAAFQIADSLILQPRANGGCLPFFVKELVVRRRPGRDAWVHVRLAGGDATLARYDIDLIDPDGTVCVSMREFSARAETAGGSGRPNTYRAAEWRAAERDGERDGNELSELNELNEGNERRRAAPRVAVLDASPRLAHALRGIGVDALWLPADAAHAARGPA